MHPSPNAFDHTAFDPCWSVVLDDETTLTQGCGVLFADLPFDRVRSMVITFAGHVHVVHLQPEQRPIYFLKGQIRLDPNDGSQTDRKIVCVGWQQTVKGVNVKSLVWLDKDGTVTHCETDPGEWRAAE